MSNDTNSEVNGAVTHSSERKKTKCNRDKDTSDISLKVIYAEFETSIASGYIFHSETGVSVLYDPFQSRYWLAQYDPEELHGDLNQTAFDLARNLGLREGIAHLELPDDSVYVVRRAKFSLETQIAFESIMMHCRAGNNSKVLTHGDKSWIEGIVSQFVEYKHGVSYDQLKPVTEVLQ